MIYPDVDLEEWKAFYDIQPPDLAVCENCDKEMKFEVPVAYGSYRGLKTPSHGCPENFDQYVDVPTDPEEILELKMLWGLVRKGGYR